MFDIYFEDNYGKLYESKPNEVYTIFKHESDLGTISHRFIKREIEETSENLYDIVTPYGYGGPIIEKLVDDTKKGQLVSEFEQSFKEYVKSEGIVSEFIRFHPVIENALDFKDIYTVTFDRNTVGTNLTLEDPFMMEFSKSARKTIRSNLKNERIRFEVEKSPANLNDFIEIYVSTMDRNEAQDKYYFTKEYFDQITSTLNDHVLAARVFLEDKLIAMGLYFAYDQYLHTHLSGTLREYLSYSPAYLLKYALLEYGKEHGYKLIHHGGGSSNKEDDSLLQFKKRFGKNTKFDFYVGKKIWNPSVYEALCKSLGKDLHSEFFPAYRSE